MCGIVGVTHGDDLPYIADMADRIYHRGPDDYGEYTDAEAGVGLAMRRLSIVDIAGGRQPMSNEDGSLWIVFNGEIYNAPQLRASLEGRHQFQTDHSDTEVLVHLYEDEGPALLSKLNGMFAFVIYDRRRRLLFGARDRVGIKPLYYTHQASRFAFASELKSLQALPWLSGEVDLESLYHYVSLQFVPAPGSIQRHVRKLPAGHSFLYRLDDGTLSVSRYWQLQVRPDRSRSRTDWIAAVRAELARSVARQTLSDVPIACSLSGGLDSSAITALLSQCQRGPVKTYSLGFAGPGEEAHNELDLARAVARKWGTEHREVIVESRHLLTDLDRMVWHLDEPYAGGLPSWYVFESIGRECKVALTGTGGDELFGNYAKWRIHERPAWYRWLRTCRDAWRYPLGHCYHRYLSDGAKDGLIFNSSRPANGTEALLEESWLQSGACSPRDAVACVDFALQLPEEFLTVTDRFSMAHAVEARVPFLDHELIELAFAIPPDIRTGPADDPKRLLREIVADLLPTALHTAPKRGFVLPLSHWLRGPLHDMVGDLLGPAALRQQGVFAPQLWDRIIAPHLAGRMEATQQVWTLLMFQLWQQQNRRTARGRRAA
jgi:asparagine synthase (glutamine-hydrolysing)